MPISKSHPVASANPAVAHRIAAIYARDLLQVGDAIGDRKTHNGQFATGDGATDSLFPSVTRRRVGAGRGSISEQISGTPIDLGGPAARFGMKPGPTSDVVNFAQTSERPEITKMTALKAAQKGRDPMFYEGQGEIMKTSTKDRIKGSFHEAKGTIKEQVGKVTSDRKLKAEGKAEKNVGKVQQRVGQAKETVARLKGKLKQLKTA